VLNEIKNVRQIPGEGYRRWFTDSEMDLIIWYDNDEITGFQLCYEKGQQEKALTWYKDAGYTHDTVDDGDRPYQGKMTPILVPDGFFDATRVSEQFRERAEKIDKELADLVVEKLVRYEPG